MPMDPYIEERLENNKRKNIKKTSLMISRINVVPKWRKRRRRRRKKGQITH